MRTQAEKLAEKKEETIYLMQLHELTPEVFAIRCGLDRIEVEVCEYVIAYRGKIPMVWVRLQAGRWIVSTGTRSYMFKDSGLFGWTTDPDNWLENSFETAREAILCFKQHYSFLL